MSDSALDALYRPFPPFSEWAGSPVDEALWEESLAILSERRAHASEAAFREMVERTMRAAAIDTGAIEGLYAVDRGFTMSVVEMATAWEAEVEAQKGPQVAALVEAQRRGYDLALDAATSGTDISEAWIRRVHEEVCGPQDTFTAHTPLGRQPQQLPKGVYKGQPNHVLRADGSIHAYAPVDATPEEMHRLVIELRSPQFETAHPVLQASFAHYAVAAVHPFSDGNGRVARVLSSVYLLRAVSVPLVVFADQRAPYVRALAEADRGDPEAFVDFVGQRAVDTVLVVAEELAATADPTVEDSVTRVTRATSLGRSSDCAELSVASERIMDQARAALGSFLERLPSAVAGELSRGTWYPEPPAGYRIRSEGIFVSVRAVSFDASGQAETRVTVSFHVAVADRLDEPFPLLIARADPYEALAVRLEEVHPVVTEAFRRRLTAWADRMVREALGALAAKAESQVQP